MKKVKVSTPINISFASCIFHKHLFWGEKISNIAAASLVFCTIYSCWKKSFSDLKNLIKLLNAIKQLIKHSS